MIESIAAAVLYLAPVNFPPARARAYATVIVRESRRRKVDPFLVVALIDRESNFEETVVNPVTLCAGLMQIAPVHFEHKYDPLDWKKNIQEGVRILAGYMDTCGSREGAISMYDGRGHCGRSNFSGWVLCTLARLERFRGRTT